MNKTVLVFLLSILLSFGLFGNGIGGDFVFDDASVVENRGDLKDPSGFFDLFISPYHQNNPKSGLYRPLTMASYALNHYISGSPAGFHAVNIAIHAVNSFLVFWLVQFLFRKQLISYAVFFLFLAHPVHTEAVTSIVGRAELLAFFWSMAAIYFFLNKKLVASGVAFFLGLLSKEIAVAVLPLLLYLDVAVLKSHSIFNSFRRLGRYLIPLAAYALLRYKALGSYFLADTATTFVENPLKFAPQTEQIATALSVLTMYMKKLIMPLGLSADYSYNSIPLVGFESPAAMIGLAILVFLIILIFYNRVQKEWAFAATVFAVPYLLISNLIKPIGTIMGERLMYFPSFGLVLAAAFGLNILAEKGRLFKRISYGILAGILILYGAGTFVRNRDWSDNRILFSAAAEESPNSVIVRTALAGVHIETGEWGEAKKELGIAQDIYEDYSRLQNLLGIVADHEGNYPLAEEKYKKSLKLNPDAVNPHLNLTELYLKQQRYLEAGNHMLQVIEFYPAAEYVVRYGYIQITVGQARAAIETAERHYGADSDHPDLNAMLGTAYFVQRDYGSALVYLKKARLLGKNNPEIAQMIQIAEQH